MSAPLVSVLLPVRNGMPWLPLALDSIRHQTFRDLEIVVLEDGSTDGTAAWLARVRDARLRVIPTQGVGIARALNAGLAAARGRYIARQDADDESLPERLAQQTAVLEQRLDVDVVCTTAEYIDGSGEIVDNAWVRTVRAQQDPALTPEAIAALLPLTCCITHGSVLARREVLHVAGGYAADFVPAEDYDLWLRLLPAHRFFKLAERLYRYRLHAAQTAAQPDSHQSQQAVRAKLHFVQRACPDLRRPARLATRGQSRGDALYAQAATEAGFTIVSMDDEWDVMAITDFRELDRWRGELAALPHVGNLFIRSACRSVLVA